MLNLFNKNGNFIYEIPNYLSNSTIDIVHLSLYILTGLIFLIIFIFFILELKYLKINKKEFFIRASMLTLILIICSLGSFYINNTYNDYIQYERYSYVEDEVKKVIEENTENIEVEKMKKDLKLKSVENSSNKFLWEKYTDTLNNNRTYGQYDNDFSDIYEFEVTLKDSKEVITVQGKVVPTLDKKLVNTISTYVDKEGNYLNTVYNLSAEDYDKL